MDLSNGRAPITQPALRRRLRSRLLKWFARHRRDLPWRHDTDPYRVWVSEVMLQQTQVATVIPYFYRFLQAFPTLTDLAAASEQEVLRVWEGLGYYRRAVNLHRAARQLVKGHDGRMPDDARIWWQLPGVGRYILGAVLSQAFGRRLPIIEANSERVLCRLFGQRNDPRKNPARRWLWQVAEELLPMRRVGDFNQALMELGALVCTPVTPHCAECPVSGDCQARRKRQQQAIPYWTSGPAKVEVSETGVVVLRGGRVLLVQRPQQGRWAGMWEFPRGPLGKQESHEQAALRLLRDLTSIRAEVGEKLLTVRHTVTHHHITLVCFEARYRSGRFRSKYYRDGRWVRPEELAAFPLSTPQRRLARALQSATNGRSFSNQIPGDRTPESR